MSGPAEFSTGLCGCFDDFGVCLYGCFCTTCLMCQNQAKVEGTKCGCRQACCPLFEYNTRQIIRRRKNMNEECCVDCMTVGYFLPLVVCQDARELNNGFGLPLPNEGYWGQIVNPVNPATQVGYPQQQTSTIDVKLV